VYARYLSDIEANANTRDSSGSSSYNVDSFKEYKIGYSKKIIDEIDDFIGPLYGLTKEEIEFIKNYEIEYRMADYLTPEELAELRSGDSGAAGGAKRMRGARRAGPDSRAVETAGEDDEELE